MHLHSNAIRSGPSTEYTAINCQQNSEYESKGKESKAIAMGHKPMTDEMNKTQDLYNNHTVKYC